MKNTIPFVFDELYSTKSGKTVRIVSVDNTPNYETVTGDDGICRYNRSFDRGRVTGSPFDMSYPENLIPHEK